MKAKLSSKKQLKLSILRTLCTTRDAGRVMMDSGLPCVVHRRRRRIFLETKNKIQTKKGMFTMLSLMLCYFPWLI